LSIAWRSSWSNMASIPPQVSNVLKIIISTDLSSSRQARSPSASQRISGKFNKVPLPCLQESASGAGPKPDESSAFHTNYYHVTSVLILSFDFRRSLSSGLFFLGFPTKILYVLRTLPCMLHSWPISYFLILSFNNI
jgi:hypothetical protein